MERPKAVIIPNHGSGFSAYYRVEDVDPLLDEFFDFYELAQDTRSVGEGTKPVFSMKAMNEVLEKVADWKYRALTAENKLNNK